MLGTAACVCFAEPTHALDSLCCVGHFGPRVGIRRPCLGSGCMDIVLPTWREGWRVETSSSGFGSKRRKFIILKKEIKLNNWDKILFNVKQTKPVLVMVASGLGTAREVRGETWPWDAAVRGRWVGHGVVVSSVGGGVGHSFQQL